MVAFGLEGVECCYQEVPIILIRLSFKIGNLNGSSPNGHAGACGVVRRDARRGAGGRAAPRGGCARHAGEGYLCDNLQKFSVLILS